MHDSRLKESLQQPRGRFLEKGIIVFPQPVVQFAGRFGPDGQPVLVTNSIPRPVPVMEPQPGQVFQGHPLVQVRPRRAKAYLVVDTITMPLAFEYDRATPPQPPLLLGSLIRLEAVPVSGPTRNPRCAWLIYQRQPDQTWRLSNPHLGERAGSCRATVQSSRPAPLMWHEIHSEIRWLELTRKEMLPEHCETLFWGDALNQARVQILGEPHRKALRNEWHTRAELADWDRRKSEARKHPQEINVTALDEGHARARAAHEHCRQQLSGIECAAAHPKVAVLIEATARSFMTRCQAIDERLKVLARLETKLLPRSNRVATAAAQNMPSLRCATKSDQRRSPVRLAGGAEAGLSPCQAAQL